jgi:hypothetical protein
MSLLGLWYDRKVDVLHITLGTPVPAEGEGRAGSIELRYAMSDNRPCGAAVIGFARHHWPQHIDRLSRVVADHLQVPVQDVKRIIAGAIR